MAWQTPKTDWQGADGVRNTDMNRIEGNILELYKETAARADITLFVDTRGNDDTGTGSSSAPFATITKALSSLPKSTSGKSVTVNIGAGTYTEDVVISGFSGVINLYSSGVVNVQSLAITGCSVYQSGTQMNYQKGIILTRGACYVGSSLMYVSNAGATGIKVYEGSTFVLYNTATVSNTTSAAVEASTGGRVYIATIAGTSNSIGMRADTGGTICYGNTSIAATTQRVTNTGGRIYTGAQTSVPNY